MWIANVYVGIEKNRLMANAYNVYLHKAASNVIYKIVKNALLITYVNNVNCHTLC